MGRSEWFRVSPRCAFLPVCVEFCQCVVVWRESTLPNRSTVKSIRGLFLLSTWVGACVVFDRDVAAAPVLQGSTVGAVLSVSY